MKFKVYSPLSLLDFSIPLLFLVGLSRNPCSKKLEVQNNLVHFT